MLTLFVPATCIRLMSRPTPALQTMRTASRMTLDSPTIRAARFPATVDHSAELLGVHKPTPPANMALLKQLLQTPDGARGTLVTVLSNPHVPHCDEPLDAQFASLVEELACRDDAVGLDLRKLLVTNVVMPSAMVVFYRERGEHQLLEASELTARRAVSLLNVVSHNEMVKTVAREFVRGLRTDEGPFGAFANKWRYGAAQREHAIERIASAMQQV